MELRSGSSQGMGFWGLLVLVRGILFQQLLSLKFEEFILLTRSLFMMSEGASTLIALCLLLSLSKKDRESGAISLVNQAFVYVWAFSPHSSSSSSSPTHSSYPPYFYSCLFSFYSSSCLTTDGLLINDFSYQICFSSTIQAVSLVYSSTDAGCRSEISLSLMSAYFYKLSSLVFSASLRFSPLCLVLNWCSQYQGMLGSSLLQQESSSPINNQSITIPITIPIPIPISIYIDIQMKGTYYSNLNTSKMSTKQIEDTCLEHEGEPFTNFCSAMTCIKPLCPECIENHYTHHKNMRTVPEIDSFRTLKNKCVAKIGDILESVSGEEADSSLNDLQSIFEASLRRVKEIREQCRRIADSYFSNLEEFIRKKMGRLTSEQSELIAEMDRVSNIVAELRLLLNKLDNHKAFLQSAETVVKLDGEKIEEKVREGTASILRFKEAHRSSLFVEKNYEHRFYNFLAATFYYGNKENLETQPKIVEELKSQQAVDALSRSHSHNLREDSEIEHSKLSKKDSRNSLHEGRGGRKEREREEDQRSNYSRKSSKKGLKGVKKEIIGMNTFSASSPRRYLHFLQHDENKLHYLDLDEGNEFQEIALRIDFRLPDYHKSIAVSNGELFVVGGAEAGGKKSGAIFRVDFDSYGLVLCNKLKYGRSSHSICFNNKYIYVLGGFLGDQNPTNRCERYDITSNKVEEIRPMRYEACSFACCSFAGRYIYKFGGVSDNNEIIHNIERYDEKTGMWEEVNPLLDIPKGEKLVPLSTSAAVQITKQEIMVLGGYDENDTGYRQTYILRVEEDGSTCIRDLNVYPLPVGEGFWSNTPVIHKKMVFALQNVSTGNNDCSGNVRRLLSFDGASWKELL